MSSLIVTPLTAGALAILFVLLSGQVIRLRRRDTVGIGHGGSLDLRRAIRVHGNFAEHVPLALIALGLMEGSGLTPSWLLWLLGGTLVVNRVLHAIGLSRSAGTSVGRFAGSALTLLFLLVAGCALIVIGVQQG